jgi:hypothetical protein
MLELRPNCELCDCDLPPEVPNARICSYECTFCANCVDTVLNNVCPNCSGGFVPRPIRPATARRKGVSRVHQPPGLTRKSPKYTKDEMIAFAALHSHIDPVDR